MYDAVPQLCLIDMTLALGADSYLRQRHPGPEGVWTDPEGRNCLRDFVDVIVNSSACYLALPAADDYWARPVLLERTTALQTIPNCASVRLRNSVELRVFTGFQETLGVLGHAWVSRWLKSQFWSPIVTRYHHPRLGATAKSFVTISDDGWEVWNRFIDKSEVARRKPLTTSMPDEPYLHTDIERAGGLAEFEYCYAFDVYRRGWLYAEAARLKNAGIKYCPHQFRRRALDAGTDGWLEAARERFWSWGEAVVQAIDAATHHIEAEQVSDWINGLLESKSPRWIDVPTLGGNHDTDEQNAREMFDRLRAIASDVGLPFPVLRSETGALKQLQFRTRDVRIQTLSPGVVLEGAYEHQESCFLRVGPPAELLRAPMDTEASNRETVGSQPGSSEAGIKFAEVSGGESGKGGRDCPLARSGRRKTIVPRVTVLNILIASPSDVNAERDVVTKAILEWNAVHRVHMGIMLDPIRWETHSFPASGERTQAIINSQIVDSGHLVIGIFGHSVGTPTGEAQSGTIEEIERFRTAGKHVALYFSCADIPRTADEKQLLALEKYQRERRKDTLYFTFNTLEELHNLVVKHLPNIVLQVLKELTDNSEAKRPI